MTEATRLDRLIAYFSPARGALRLSARLQLEMLAYEGARKSRREDGWRTGSTSANAEISMSRRDLRNRTRSLLRDNPYAVKGLATLVTNRIGTGILAAASSGNERLDKRANSKWQQFVDRCDFYGKTDLYGIESLAESTRIASGEALIKFARVEPESPDDIGIRLQVLEPDFIDTRKIRMLEDGLEIIDGIEYQNGRVVAFWIYDFHPGDTSLRRTSLTSSRIPASDILHYYRPMRAGQLTGVTEFASVIRRLDDLDGYADAELVRKRLAACAVAAVTTPGGLPGSSLAPTKIGSDGRRQEIFAPGMTTYLKPGETVNFFDPTPTNGFREYFGVELHAIAAGLGVPYELLTGDLSEVTYTSHRGGLVQFRAMVEADQWQMIIPQLCRPIWDRFILELEMRKGASMPVTFTPPRFGLLDPAKEIPAMVQAIQGGIRSWSDTIRREGYEPKDVLAEIAADNAAFDAAGVALTSDGRNAVKQTAAPAPAPADTTPTETPKAA